MRKKFPFGCNIFIILKTLIMKAKKSPRNFFIITNPTNGGVYKE
jgi:hypothetical protein